ncbi:MAG: flagellar motor switch protein FliN [Alphaproteobacteria bacterium]|nr:flagellar motor switch protein FliN [Alphaproteobacteria bacterium]
MDDDTEEEQDTGSTAFDMRALESISEVPVQISAVLGRAVMDVNTMLKLGKGAVIELDRKLGQAIDVYVNNRLVARGEVVINDERLGITMTEIVKNVEKG